MAKIPSYKFTELRAYIREALDVAKHSKNNCYYHMDAKDIDTIVEVLEDALEVLEEMDEQSQN